MATRPPDRQTFVLVHGGFHGGWCWRRVSDALRTAGHTVFTPTLTGLGERAHLLNESVSISTWVTDIIRVLENEELDDVTLVGHSFGGIVVTGVADIIPERLRNLVYLDAALIPSGSSPLEGSPADEADRRRKLAAGGTTIPTFSPNFFGVTESDDAAWLQRRMTPHPIRTYLDPVYLSRPLGNGLPCTYIACTDPWYPSVELSQHRAKATPDWRWIEIPTGHDAMITAPELLTDALLDIAII